MSADLDEQYNWGSRSPATPPRPPRETVRITYTVSHLEEIHPDPSVARRMREIGLGPCGCKVYADPLSEVRVLAHNSAYGCFK